jgi:hypothetical protein
VDVLEGGVEHAGGSYRDKGQRTKGKGKGQGQRARAKGKGKGRYRAGASPARVA